MPVEISRPQIDAALPKVREGLSKYLWLQSEIAENEDACNSPDFRRKFNHFYRVRRGAAWQQVFYELMGTVRQNGQDFCAVLDVLRRETGRYEASFASKLIATIHPTEPIIDSVVLANLGLQLPKAASQNRSEEICHVHTTLRTTLNVFLQGQEGKYLLKQFKIMYPHAQITDIKMLDLVLWQTRG